MLSHAPVPNQKLSSPQFEDAGVEVWVKRLDLVHPEISGNKFFKLKYNLQKAQELGFKGVLTFGGAYSNHIYATALAAKATGLKSIGLIRGERSLPLNATLSVARNAGMQIEYIDRTRYRTKSSPEFLASLKSQFGSFYLIPEGGTNELAIFGTKEILTQEDDSFTHVVCSIGTAGTFAGLALGKSDEQKLLGISSLKGEFIHQEVIDLFSKNGFSSPPNWEIQSGFHFGGYAKTKPELITFIWDFYQKHGIPLDPIYTGKAAYALEKMIGDSLFPNGSKVLFIHTGGLQGNDGFTERTGIKLPPSR